ncbi:hypothetical protein [Nocardia sp. NPDC050435]|uniref:hypothetical protein n=1 Tax=Nocardia sp. NPDC050435 TaxID=3155040 RepID=UPI0033DFE678
MSVTVLVLFAVVLPVAGVAAAYVTVAASYWWEMRQIRRTLLASASVRLGDSVRWRGFRWIESGRGRVIAAFVLALQRYRSGPDRWHWS